MGLDARFLLIFRIQHSSLRWSGSNYFDYMRLFHAVMDGNAEVLYDFNPFFFESLSFRNPAVK